MRAELGNNVVVWLFLVSLDDITYVNRRPYGLCVSLEVYRASRILSLDGRRSLGGSRWCVMC